MMDPTRNVIVLMPAIHFVVCTVLHWSTQVLVAAVPPRPLEEVVDRLAYHGFAERYQKHL